MSRSMPHMSSRTPLRGHQRGASSMSLPFAVVAAFHPKRPRNRISILALLALISVSAFVLCSYYPLTTTPAQLLFPSTPASPLAEQQQQVVAPLTAPRLGSDTKKQQHKQQFTSGRPPISLTPAQELAAVSAFLISLPQNVIPPSVDPARSIDPELVLDFDTRGPGAKDEVQRVVEDVWAQNPVVLFCKLYSPASRELKAMLNSLNLRPPPFIMDVDMRDDAEVLIPLLSRLTESTELPILLVGGQPVGSLAGIRELQSTGELQRRINAAGAVVGGGGKRRKGHRK